MRQEYALRVLVEKETSAAAVPAHWYKIEKQLTGSEGRPSSVLDLQLAGKHQMILNSFHYSFRGLTEGVMCLVRQETKRLTNYLNKSTQQLWVAWPKF